MGKKRRRFPDVEEILGRPWCYYCERDFEDLKLLISHQKAKHFKCDRCGRRLNTAGGLSVHLNQVHKETLTQVENALPNRQGLDVEIFGMEGIPADILELHRNRIIQNFYQEQEDRRIATGNPVPGGNSKPKKKLQFETKDELMARFREHQARVRAIKANGGATSGSPAGFTPFPPPEQAQFGQPGYQGPPGAPAYPPQQFPGGAFGGLPPRPAGAASGPPPAPGATTGLPQRPTYPGSSYPAPGAPGATGAFPSGNASTIDELVASGAQHGDDIDQLIRMAEAGIKPQRGEGGEAAAGAEELADKKAKKDKGRMVYADSEVSPEERMALLPRYAFVPEA